MKERELWVRKRGLTVTVSKRKTIEKWGGEKVVHKKGQVKNERERVKLFESNDLEWDGVES